MWRIRLKRNVFHITESISSPHVSHKHVEQWKKIQARDPTASLHESSRHNQPERMTLGSFSFFTRVCGQNGA